MLADRADLAVGVSEYNRLELVDAGFDQTGVLPLVVDTARLTSTAGRSRRWNACCRMDSPTSCSWAASRRTRRSRITSGWPSSKRYVDIALPFHFRRTTTTPCRHYYATIRALIAEHKMLPDRFWFTGPCPMTSWRRYYRHAHAYVSLSEHEGFCVPLVEAMAMDAVLAHGARLCRRRSAAPVSRSHRKISNSRPSGSARSYMTNPSGSNVIADQRRRLANFSLDRLEPHLQSLLAAVATLHQESFCETCLHRPTLRHRDPRRRGVSTAASLPNALPKTTRSKC